MKSKEEVKALRACWTGLKRVEKNRYAEAHRATERRQRAERDLAVALGAPKIGDFVRYTRKLGHGWNKEEPKSQVRYGRVYHLRMGDRNAWTASVRSVNKQGADGKRRDYCYPDEVTDIARKFGLLP